MIDWLLSKMGKYTNNVQVGSGFIKPPKMKKNGDFGLFFGKICSQKDIPDGWKKPGTPKSGVKTDTP